MRNGRFLLALGLQVLLSGIAGPAAWADAREPAGGGERPPTIVLAQVGASVQSACISTCSKRCDADYKVCSMNGKAPRFMLDHTCTPNATKCSNNCSASCTK